MAQGNIKSTGGINPLTIRKKIVVLDTGAAFSEDLMDYATHLAARLACELLVVSVDTGWEGANFWYRAETAARVFKQRAYGAGVHCSCMLRQGDLLTAVEALKREEKRIEFILVDADVKHEALGRQIALPIFSILNKTFHVEGGQKMADPRNVSKRKAAVKTILFGAMSAALYAVLFMNKALVMDFFTRGGAYAAMPVVTALGFSFVHGAFASNTFGLLGIEAAKKGALRQVEKKVIEKQKKAVKKPRTYAYINPFHRI